MSERHLKRTPHNPRNRDDVWWYEENGGITICVESDPVKRGVKQVHIPWRSIRAALKRKDAR